MLCKFGFAAIRFSFVNHGKNNYLELRVKQELIMSKIHLEYRMASTRFVLSLAFLWLSASTKTGAQTFTAIADTFEGVYYSAVAWGDYDNDNDLDIIAAGFNSKSLRVAKIYRNENARFVDANAALEGVDAGAVAWGDYDHDGDLDILLTGNSTNFGPISRVYRNDSGNFIELDAGLIGLSSSACAWGDYDNDGDLDILLAGFLPAQGPASIIYRNDRDQFVNSQIALPGVYEGSVAWGDYDNDGDLDILLTGLDNAGQHIAKIYRNDGGEIFSNIAAPLTGVSSSATAWGDYDNDGDLDMALCGFSKSGEVSEIYRNDDGNFTNINGALIGAYTGTVAWGDYDNDDDLDILLTGRTFADTTLLAIVYQNNDGSFLDISAGLTGAQQGAAAWGDYDKDGDLDILLTGASSQGSTTKIYRNETTEANTLPNPPQNILAFTSHDTAIFVWDKTTDVETPQAGLTYNLRVGTTPGGSEIVAPMAEAITGYRLIPQLGNTNHNNFGVIAGLSEGKYYWSAQAIDHAFAGSAFAPEDSFFIGDLEAPKILNVNAPATADSGTSIAVSANVTDDVAVQEVWLLYREGGRVAYDSTAMIFNINQSFYQADIPKSVARIRGVEFNIAAGDGSFNRKTFGWRSVQIKLRDRDLRKNHLGGSAQNAYRLISIPLASDDPSVNSVLLPDLGAPDTTVWRMWAINPQQPASLFPYIEYPAVGNLAAGKAKFLIAAETKTLTSGAGVTVKTAEPFAIPLQTGWNMIASPFNFAIPLQNVQPQELQTNLYDYNGSWQSAPDSLRPWEGYMIKVSSPITLLIRPSESIVTPPAAITKPNWQIRIGAKCEGASDFDNMIGVAENAAMEWDDYERFEPPPIGEFVMLAFPHRDWPQKAEVYTTDFQPPVSTGQIWNFTVDTNISGQPVTLRFDNLDSAPAEFEMRLMDMSLKLTQDLRRETQYVYRSTRDGGKKTFRLLIGKSSFIAEHTKDVAAIPATYELAQNFPNPFNPATVIKFGLPKKSKVSLKIYNLMGKEIAALLDEREKEAGYHVAVWDGYDRHRHPAPSGLYFYRLQIGQNILTKKMTLIK